MGRLTRDDWRLTVRTKMSAERRNRLCYLALYYAIQGEDRRSEQIRQMVKRVDEAKDAVPARVHQEPTLA